MSYPPVLLIGGSGFVGRSVTTRLVERGYSVIIPTRKPGHPNQNLQTPQIQWVEGSVHEPQFLDSLCRQIGPAGTVINLVGLLHDKPAMPYGLQFKAAHVDLVQMILDSMKASGVRRILHMSALGANRDGASMYQRSKGEGEYRVRSSNLDWTIFRPSVIFGTHDNFINLFSKLARRFPVLPLACASARFQPVSVENVAEALVRSIAMPQTLCQSYDLAGPQILTLAELVQFAARRTGHPRPIISLPAWLGMLQAMMFEVLPEPMLMSRDNLASMRHDNVLPPGALSALDSVFGIQPETLNSLLK